MIVGFSRHGKGAGHGPVSYLVCPDRPSRQDSPPVILRGDADQTRRLIDSLTFRHRYTSGVLSFAPGETITPEMERTIMDGFEKLAFAGLEADQYSILWVRHSHAGHHKLHFITPRVELSTGKSLNIRPPGRRTERQFDDFRSEINARYGLADPTDPDRARTVSSPGHELKRIAEALRQGQEPPENMRELLDGVLTQRAVAGDIRSRQELLRHVRELGLEVPRAGKNYITIREPQSGQRWRLKGPLYEDSFSPGRTLEAADAGRLRDYSKPDERAARRFAERVARHHAERAAYHQDRYGGAGPQAVRTASLVPDPAAAPDRTEPLARYLGRELGDDALPDRPDQGPSSHDRHDGRDGPGTSPSGRENSVQLLRSQGLREDRRNSPSLSGRLSDSGRILNHDGTGNAVAERIGRVTAAARQATADLSARAAGFTGNVQTHHAGQSVIEGTARYLERACRFLAEAARTVQSFLKGKDREPSRGGRSF